MAGAAPQLAEGIRLSSCQDLKAKSGAGRADAFRLGGSTSPKPHSDGAYEQKANVGGNDGEGARRHGSPNWSLTRNELKKLIDFRAWLDLRIEISIFLRGIRGRIPENWCG